MICASGFGTNITPELVEVAPGMWVVANSYDGEYEHFSRELADELRSDRVDRIREGSKRFVAAVKGRLWCAMCGKWGGHQSGNCPELKGSCNQ